MNQRLHDRDAAIEQLLSVARRETLMLAAASAAVDDAAAAIASARLRWAIGSARTLIAGPGGGGHAERLDRLAERARRWLAGEPPRPLREIGGLVERAAQRDRRAPAIRADHAALVDLDLDDLELARLSLCGARLVDVGLRRARCIAADARDSRWLRCALDCAALSTAVFAGAHLERCDLSCARLTATSWHRAVLAGCTLRGASLVDARLDRAVFRDCDLRGADLAIARSPHVAPLAGTEFVRCDLRDTRWRGRELAGASFVDCRPPCTGGLAS